MTKNNGVRRYFLAIRHRPSGGLLPNVRGYGFTRTEPSMTEPPRLFVRHSSAKQALNYWLQGELFEKTDSDSDFGDEVTLHCHRRNDRHEADMEIVEVEIVVRTLAEAQLRII
jgi:hypothetical protein